MAKDYRSSLSDTNRVDHLTYSSTCKEFEKQENELEDIYFTAIANEKRGNMCACLLRRA